MSGDLTSLVKEIDKKIEDGSKLCAFVVVLSDDAEATEAELKKLAEKEAIKKVPLTYVEGASGPPNYKIAKDAEVTVHLWVGLEVKANHAYESGKFDKAAVKEILADLPKILDAPAKSEKPKPKPKNDE